jgi:DNA-binding MarR family transcriptional regulator
MSEKTIHIVFQVLNFITSEDSTPYQLTADEEKLLLILASHKGDKGIYPGIPTLAAKTKRHRTNVIKTLSKLEEKDLLLIDRLSGRSNHYTLTIPTLKLSTTSSAHATSSVDTTSSADATTPVVSTLTTSSVHATRLALRRSKKNKTERGRASLASPLSVFQPSEQNQFLASDLRLDLAAELESFRHRHKGEKNQYEFERWLKNSHAYRSRQPSGKSVNEPMPQRSTYVDMPPVIRTPQSDAIREKAMQEMRGFLRKTIVTGK